MRCPLLMLTGLVMFGCAGSPRSEQDTAPEVLAVGSLAEPESLDCATAVVDGCTTLQRVRVPSPAAKAFGLMLDPDGDVTCDREAMDCGELGRPAGMVLERLSEDCGYYGDAILRTLSAVYILIPQSIGVNGGPGYYLGTIEGADPATFVPLGHMMGRDALGVFDYGNRVEDLDPHTFRVTDPEFGCLGCDADRCLVDCVGHPLSRPRFCFIPRSRGDSS